MNRPEPTPLAPELEHWLAADHLEVPTNFEQRVLAQLPVLSTAAQAGRAINIMRWLFMAGGGAVALTELFTFLFGFWSATSAL